MAFSSFFATYTLHFSIKDYNVRKLMSNFAIGLNDSN